MWISFLIACIVLVAVLWVPGAIAVRALTGSVAASLCLAPAVSLGAYVVLGVAFDVLGLRVPGAVLFLAAVLPAALLRAWCRARGPRGAAAGASGGVPGSGRGRVADGGVPGNAPDRARSRAVAGDASDSVRVRPGSPVPAAEPASAPDGACPHAGLPARAAAKAPFAALRARRAWLFPLAYAAVGALAAAWCWLALMDGADAFSRTVDNAAHLAFIRVMAEGGSFSILHVSAFADQAGGFYPAAWHVAAALAVDLAGVSVPVAENALDFLCAAIVFPMGCCALIFAATGNRRATAAGAAVSVAFAAFPWMFLTYGILCANLAGNALLPSVAAIMVYGGGRGRSRAERLRCGALLVPGAIALVGAQPNSFFAAVVILAPWLVWRAGDLADLPALGLAGRRRLAARIGFGLAAAAIVAAGWAVAYRLPMMQGVVSTVWPLVSGLRAALAGIPVLAFRDAPAQPVLGALVVLGFARCLVPVPGRGRLLWLDVSYLLTLVIHVVAVATDGPFKAALSGFWYTDSYRTAALASIAAVPLAAIGLAWAAEILVRALRWAAARTGGGRGEVGEPREPRAGCGAAVPLWTRRQDGKGAFGGEWVRGAGDSGSLSRSASRPVPRAMPCDLPLSVPRTLPVQGRALMVIACLALAVLVYGPGNGARAPEDADTAFGYLRARSASGYDMGERVRVGDGVPGRVFDRSAMDFCERAHAVAGDDLVLNEPFDGSAFAFGATGLNVYYRSLHPYGGADESADSRLFRTSADRLATDPSVGERLRAAGVRYVLVLDYDGIGASPVYRFTYDASAWTGLRGIRDGAPGLETVLSEGDMRLYRIVDAA